MTHYATNLEAIREAYERISHVVHRTPIQLALSSTRSLIQRFGSNVSIYRRWEPSSSVGLVTLFLG